MSQIEVMMEKGLLIVLSGPSGAGKGTLLSEVKKMGLDFKLSVSVTTRAPRVGEVEGVNYFFKTKEQVEIMKKNGELLESKEVFGNTYGTSKKFVEDNLNLGNDVVLEIDTQGAFEVKSKKPEAVMIFIVPKDLQTLHDRLVGRGTEDEKQVLARFGEAKAEIANAKKYDYLIINDTIEKCAQEFIAIVNAEKLKTSQKRNLEIIENFK